MTPLLRKLLGFNWLIVALMLALAAFGVLAIYSCTYMRADPNYVNMWRKQATWVVCGMVTFIVLSLVDYRWLKWGSLPLYLGSVAFLVLTLIIGKKIDNARCWLQLGPLTFQPAQLAIVAGIITIAIFLTEFRNLHPMLKLLATGVMAGAPMLLILKQPDLGEVIVWVPVLLALWFAGGIPKRYLIVILLLGVALIPIVANLGLKDYQRLRLVSFLDPDIDPQKTSWAINQSLIAIGSGGWAGKGFKAPNTQVELGFLPKTTVPNDYIFAAIGEQWGFIGGVMLVGAYAVLLMTIVIVALRSADEFGVLIAVGVLAMLFFHIYQNIGMTVSIMPITGVPLPLVSYSGSFVLMVMFALGLVNSVWVHRKALP
jgi:rod shape determining protein RodA